MSPDLSFNIASLVKSSSFLDSPDNMRSLPPSLPLLYLIITSLSLSHSLDLQVYWIGPVLGSILAGVSHEFFFARSASRQKLVACLTCKDIEIVETASMTGSSLSTVTQNAMRAKQANKQENN